MLYLTGSGLPFAVLYASEPSGNRLYCVEVLEREEIGLKGRLERITTCASMSKEESAS
jgi:hypothetical protein